MVVCVSNSIDNAIDVSDIRKSDCNDPWSGADILANSILQVTIHKTTTRGYIRALFRDKEYLYPMVSSYRCHNILDRYEFYAYVSLWIYY